MKVGRIKRIKKIEDPDLFKKQLLHWSAGFSHICWMDSNHHQQAYGSYDALLAVDAEAVLQTSFQGAFESLSNFRASTTDWIFGYLSYDLKNDIEELQSENIDGAGFPDLFFFRPRRLILIEQNQVIFEYLVDIAEQIDSDFRKITGLAATSADEHQNKVRISLRTHKDEYFNKVENILDHIRRGDIYEVNFCQEFFAEQTIIDPITAYRNLNAISSPPFATFLKNENLYVLSASPERYLRKQGSLVISQPIKGTSKRSEDPAEDVRLKLSMENDPKERSENIMIVDLVRNDLSRIALKGTVEVEELCGVYSFEQVHQMISTVKADTSDDVDPVDIIKASFPMGSMTGAPKISAMKIIEELEDAKRGVYSGAVGYFTPGGDFDFNVVIRSILYNESNAYISFSVGGAITAKSDPMAEYEECLIKAKAMRLVLDDTVDRES